MFALRMEARLRVRGVVDNLQLPLLVVVSVPAVQDTVSVPLLVFELPVVSHPGVVAVPVAVGTSLSVDLERHLLWLGVTLLREGDHENITHSGRLTLTPL